MDEAHSLVCIEDVCSQGLQFLQHLAKEVNGKRDGAQHTSVIIRTIFNRLFPCCLHWLHYHLKVRRAQ